MDTSPRLPIGQLLGRLLRTFRQDLHRRSQEAGYTDVREAHLQVFGAIDWTGTRLSVLAARSNMTAPAMSELVDELERAGYVERRPDRTDGRAKLIRPTRKGRRLLVEGLRAVREIEAGYADLVGPERFEAMASAMERLVDATSGSWVRRDR
jgi:DNA-binding MarR family transcriptional regulator